MLRYYYINKEWMVSPTARRTYRASAGTSLTLFLVLSAVRFTARLGIAIPPNLFPIIRLLLFAGVVGTAISIVAMEYFLFGFDKSSAWKRLFWFCALLLPPFGPALYCFFVCSRATRVRPEAPSLTVGRA